MLYIPWDNSYYSRSVIAVWNLGHLPLFAGLSLLLLRFSGFVTARYFESRLILVLLLAVVAGLAIEVTQYYLAARNISWRDVYVDVTGAGCTVIWFSDTQRIHCKASLKILRLLSVAAVFFSLFPLLMDLADEYRAHKQFPVLADFESGLELQRFSGGVGLEPGDGVLTVSFGTETYSGFALKYFPRDWRGYEGLHIDVVNPNQGSISLTCRIHDFLHNHAYDDRYNRRFLIPPGRQVINIDLEEVKYSPATRLMDMSRIGALGCFTTRLRIPVSLLLTRIALH